jgi:NAD+ dependent glucose-6-phosphate dehydrogenase
LIEASFAEEVIHEACLKIHPYQNSEPMAKKSILITGVYGLVGSVIYKSLLKSKDDYELFGMDRSSTMSDRVSEEEAIEVPKAQFFQSDLSDIERLTAIFQGKHSIVHMAGNPNTDANWDSLLENNICGGYHVLEAAKRAGVKRVVLASTIQVSTGYARWVEPYKSIAAGEFDKVPETFDSLKTTDATWPINLYAASKVFCETLARVYSSTSDLSCICLRIGAVNSRDEHPNHLSPVFCSQNDIGRLAECCINAPDSLKFDIFYGMSANKYLWPDIANAEKNVGYKPEDKSGY